jgi:pilus assembly protein Flp/PilA
MLKAYIKVSEGLRGARESARNLALKVARDEEGASLVEYSVLIGLITVAVIAIILAVGNQIEVAWQDLTNALAPELGDGGLGGGGGAD